MRFSLFVVLLLCFTFPALAEEKESAFDRVMRTQTIRCGYYVFPPIVHRDAQTNALSGFSIDMMEALAKRAGLKVEWADEVNFGNWVPALQSNRFDAVCTPMWPEIAMAKAAAFTTPLFYTALSPLVRTDDPRFKNDSLERLNKPDVTFLTQDGNAIDSLTREFFFHAKIVSVPGSVDGPTILQNIVTKKADAILLDRNGEIEYNKNNPVKLRLVNRKHPVKVQPFSLVVGRNETVLKDFLDNAVRDLNNDGSIDRYLKKWEKEPNLFLRVVKPYEAVK